MFDCQWSPVDGVKAAGSATRPCIPAAGFGRHAKGMVSDFKGGGVRPARVEWACVRRRSMRRLRQPQTMEADEYVKLVAVEDRMWYFRALHAHVARALDGGDLPEDANVLDAGCGTGGLLRRLSGLHPGWKWTGVDLSPAACRFARERAGPTTEIKEASVTALPFPDASFDALVSADALYHVADDAAALREFARVLRPGGIVVVNVPAYRWLWSYHDDAVHSCRRYGRREVLAKLGGAGFSGTEATFWNTLPFPLIVARRKLLPRPRGGSDVRLFPPAVEAAFNLAMAVERAWLRGGGSLPFGVSIFAVGRKPAVGPAASERPGAQS
ncbi:MAG: class I SAM-dependent methyltransferase [Opitutus sp.]|nr:class I SAM-dependent methyltransferase [Opitutus sp.]